MVCGFDFDYPNWLYRTVMIIAGIGTLLFVINVFIYSSNQTQVTLWLLISGVILIIPAIIVFFTRSSYYHIFLFLNLETTGKNKILHVNFNVILIFNNQQHKYEHYH